MSQKMVLLCLALFSTVYGQLRQIPGLYIDKVSIGAINGTVYSYDNNTNFTGYYFSRALSTPLPTSVISIGLGLYQYDIGYNTSLSLVAEVDSYNSSSTTIWVLPVSTSGAFVYLSYSVVAITEDNDQVQMLRLQCSNFNMNQYVASSKFTFQSVVETPFTTMFYQWVTCNEVIYDNDGFRLGLNKYTVNSSAPRFYCSTSHSLSKSACANILLVNSTDSSLYSLYSQDGQSYPHIFNNNFGVDISLYDYPLISQRCLLALSQIHFHYHINQLSQFYLITNANDVTNIASVNLYGGILVTFCFAIAPINCSKIENCFNCSNLTYCEQCISNGFLFDANSIKCQPCSYYMPGCLECTSEMNCTLCGSKLKQLEIGCYCQVGTIVGTECSQIPGCINFATKMDGSQTCLICNATSFEPIPVNGVCICLNNNYLFNGNCYSLIPGCILYMPGSNGGSYCGFCNINKGFYLTSLGQCQCKQKTEFIDNVCKDICGDGFLMNTSTYACDDGNTISEDGCSSDCLVEVGYICQNGSNQNASVCVYVRGGAMLLELISTFHTYGQNQGKFSFTISPSIKNLNRMNYYDYLTFDCNSTYEVSSISYEDGVMEVLVDYTVDMENRDCNVSLAYDPTIADKPPSTLSFTAQSDNTGLIVFSNFDLFETFQSLFSILSYSIIIVFLLSLPFKMLGVELINCSQIVYFSLCLYERPIILYEGMKNFHLVTGYWPFFEDEATTEIVGFTDRISINLFFSKCTMSILAVLTPVMVVWVILKVILKCQQEKDKKPQPMATRGNVQESNIEKAIRIVYNWLLFPFATGFMTIFYLSAYLNNSRILIGFTSATLTLNSMVLLLVWLILSTVLVGQMALCLPQGGPPQNPRMKAWYIPLYLIKLTAVSLLYSFQIQFRFGYVLEVILGIQTFFMIFIVLNRPYRQIFMTIGAVMCELTAFYSLLLILMRRFSTPTEDMDAVMVYALMGLIGGSTLLTFLRTLRCAYIANCKEEAIEQITEMPKLGSQREEESMLRKPMIMYPKPTQEPQNIPVNLSKRNQPSRLKAFIDKKQIYQDVNERSSRFKFQQDEALSIIKQKHKQNLAKFDKNRHNQIQKVELTDQ